MKNKALLIATLLISITAVCQNQDDLVTVPKKYVSAEGLNHTPEPVEQVSKWVGIGHEVGIATKEGLNSVVDVAEKFGATKVGTFVMVMIAWKIMGSQLLGVVLGIPIGIAGICLWIWAMKRFFFGYRVLAKKEGKVKTYEDHPAYEFDSRDSRAGVGAVGAVMLTAWMIASLVIIFG